MDEPIDRATLVGKTAEIVAAFVAHNRVQPAELGGLIGSVAGRLASLGTEEARATPAKPEPAVPVRRSVTRDEIVCLICGKKQKLLKRHLAAAHGLTPDQYRELFGLKRDYPMVAPSYAQARSEMALRIGLGRPKQQARARPSARRRSGARPSGPRGSRPPPSSRAGRVVISPAAVSAPSRQRDHTFVEVPARAEGVHHADVAKPLRLTLRRPRSLRLLREPETRCDGDGR